jgi:hypothetical protein
VTAQTKTQRIEQLERKVDVLAYLHAERDHHLLTAFRTVTHAVNVLAWLYAEREEQLRLFIESEERLIRRARAVKAAKTQAAERAAGVRAH